MKRVCLIFNWMCVPGNLQLAYRNTSINPYRDSRTDEFCVQIINQQATDIQQVMLNSEKRRKENKRKGKPPKGKKKRIKNSRHWWAQDHLFTGFFTFWGRATRCGYGGLMCAWVQWIHLGLLSSGICNLRVLGTSLENFGEPTTVHGVCSCLCVHPFGSNPALIPVKYRTGICQT